MQEFKENSFNRNESFDADDFGNKKINPNQKETIKKSPKITFMNRLKKLFSFKNDINDIN